MDNCLALTLILTLILTLTLSPALINFNLHGQWLFAVWQGPVKVTLTVMLMVRFWLEYVLTQLKPGNPQLWDPQWWVPDPILLYRVQEQ